MSVKSCILSAISKKGNSSPKPKTRLEHERDAAVDELKRWLHTPYYWAGDDFSAIDCSGLIMEVLKSIGRFGERRDLTADGLLHLYEHNAAQKPYKGCLIFWLDKKNGKAKHVAMMIDDRFLIHAAGGGKPVLKYEDIIAKYPILVQYPPWLLQAQIREEEARRLNAYVKQRELAAVAAARMRAYTQIYVIVDPFKDHSKED